MPINTHQQTMSLIKTIRDVKFFWMFTYHVTDAVMLFYELMYINEFINGQSFTHMNPAIYIYQTYSLNEVNILEKS